MKATDVIRRDHRAAEELFTKFKNASEDEQKTLEEQIFKALDAHEKMEDTHFYPALDGALDDDETFKELEREQGVLETEVAGIKALPVGRAEALKLAMDKVLTHAKREEEHVLTKAEELLSEEKLEELGQQMEPMSAVAQSE